MAHSHAHCDTHDHGHDHHDHAHGHMHAPATFNLAFALAVGLNLAFTLIEGGYAFIAHSMSLLADAGHNLGDVIGLLMSWGATWLLGRSATEKYSYGYKKTTLFAALINALILVFACAIIIYESIHKLFTPVPIRESIVIIVAFIGILINGGTALMFLKGSKDDLNIKGAYLHLASDALISVGVVVTGIIVLFTKWNWLDPIVGLIIVTIILRSAC
jgi:cobalt-zinc-cadmium efflux system protein